MPFHQLSIFCLIQGIINYVQINTYWSCIVRIGIFVNLTSNILLLASKKCFLTSQEISQGLLGAGMNCRALRLRMVPCKIILKELSSVSYCEKSGYLRCIKDIKNIIFFNTITLSGVGVDWTVRANIGRVWRVGSFQIYQAKKGALVSKYTLIPLVNLTIYIFFATMLKLSF